MAGVGSLGTTTGWSNVPPIPPPPEPTVTPSGGNTGPVADEPKLMPDRASPHPAESDKATPDVTRTRAYFMENLQAGPNDLNPLVPAAGPPCGVFSREP